MRLRKENGGKRESSTPVKDKEKFRNAALSPSPPLLSSFPCRAAGEKLKNRKGEKNVCLGEEASEKRCVGKGKKREEKIPGRKNSGGGMELSEKRPGKVSSAGKFCSEAEEYVALCSRSIPPFFQEGGGMGWKEEKASSILPPILRETGRESPVQAKCFLIRELIFFRRARTAASPRGYSFMLMRPPGESLSSMAQSFSRGTFPSRRRNARKS